MKKINIIYIGNSIKMLQYLLSSTIFSLQGIVCEKKRDNSQFERLACESGVAIAFVDNKQQLVQTLQKWNISVAVMYEFGIIIPEEVIEMMDVYNFHAGSLKNNRGSSPIHWSILLGEKETEMSLYKISKEIDLGEVVSIQKCKIDNQAVPSTLRIQLESNIPQMLTELEDFIKEKKVGTIIREGIYRQRLKIEDYTIDANNDTEYEIDCKIRSQADYQGAIFCQKDEMFYVKSLQEYYCLKEKN